MSLADITDVTFATQNGVISGRIPLAEGRGGRDGPSYPEWPAFFQPALICDIRTQN
jgi:hypothetical protein